jgi:hypothetical protein
MNHLPVVETKGSVHRSSPVLSSPPPIPAGLARVLQDSSGLCRIASQSVNIGSQSCQAWQGLDRIQTELGRIYFKLEYITKKQPVMIYLYTNIHFFVFNCCICRITPYQTPLLVLLPSLYQFPF